MHRFSHYDRSRVCIALLTAIVLLALAGTPRLLAVPAAAVIIVDRGDDLGGLPCTGAPADCTLRSAVQYANANSGAVINFDNDYTIVLSGVLPTITAAGTKVNGVGHNILIDANNSAQAFVISASDVDLAHLNIYGAGASASNIYITGSAVRVTLSDNVIGAKSPGPGCGLSPNAYGGVYIDSTGGTLSGTDARVWIFQNTIRCNLGSPGEGITLHGTDSVVIGEDPAGTLSANGINSNHTGIKIEAGANFNRVRSAFVDSNTGPGIVINGAGTNNNIVLESEIGNNGAVGVRIDGGAQNNLIGNSALQPRAKGNLVHRNTGGGIYISGSGTAYNQVYGNNVGTDYAGTAAESNGTDGIVLDNLASFNYIGYGGAGRNLISGNLNDGMQLKGGAHDNLVQGNYIGVDITGTTAITNLNGIAIFGGATNNLIGGTLTLTQNIISGNLHDGVTIAGSSTTTNTLSANSLGYDQVGGRYLPPNGWDNIVLDGQTSGNIIGGDFAPNAIENAGGTGIAVQGGAQSNQILYNYVTGNGGYGIRFYGVGTSYNVISRTAISFNGATCSGCDGIGERSGATANFWSEVSMHDNAGLGIDKFASSDADNTPNPPNLAFTSINVNTGVVQGSANPTVPAFLWYTTVELYRVALDPSSFGEGWVFVGRTLTDSTGAWTITDPTPAASGGCYTAFTTETAVLGSTEFSRNSCTLFLPLVRR